MSVGVEVAVFAILVLYGLVEQSVCVESRAAAEGLNLLVAWAR